MTSIIRAVLAFGLLMWLIAMLGGCTDGQVDRPSVKPTPQNPATSVKVEREDRIVALQRDVDEAAAKHDEVGRLSAKVALSEERTKVAEQQVVDLKRETKQDKADLATAKEAAQLAAWRARLYWFAGILGALALAGVLVAIFQPEVAKWAVRFSVACAAVASLAVFVTRLLPYLWWIGGAVVVAGAVGYLLWGRLSDKTRRQVVGVVDKYKKQIPDYKAKFGELIDDDADHMIDRTREHLGVKKAP